MANDGDEITFSDLLFELSNDIRYNILRLIKSKPMRPSVIANQLGLTPPEVSRNFSRLYESKLIDKDTDNHYSITNLGEQFLNLLEELEFISQHGSYFNTHKSVKIPLIFQKRLSELSHFNLSTSFMEFVTHINEIIKESQSFVWLYIDQYPLIALDSIRSSIERGVEYKIIEQCTLLGPKIAFEEKHLLSTPDMEPVVQIKIQNECNVYLLVSDAGCAIAFPSKNGFDYSGFITRGNNDTSWGMDLFNYYWEDADTRARKPDIKDSIDLSNTTNTKARAVEWIKVFSKLEWSKD